MAQKSIAMPPSLAKRPRYLGLPIPFITPLAKDGTPQFALNNVALKLQLMRERRCALCGEPMGEWVAFIDSELACRERLFVEPPMHPDCAQYATQACPFLSNPNYGQAERRPIRPAAGGLFTIITNEAQPGPYRDETVKLGIFITSQYQIVDFGSEFAAQASPPRQIKWFYRGPEQ